MQLNEKRSKSQRKSHPIVTRKLIHTLRIQDLSGPMLNYQGNRFASRIQLSTKDIVYEREISAISAFISAESHVVPQFAYVQTFMETVRVRSYLV
jgi:hypothetical protein